jgi:DNA-binding beta-propeller fold protein YncE
LLTAWPTRRGNSTSRSRSKTVVASTTPPKALCLTTWSVPAPGALAARPDGSLAAISNGKLVELRDGKVSPLADQHVDEPAGVAVAGGRERFTSRTRESCRTSRLSPTGEYLKSIGKPGGRPWVGRFDPSGMLKPAGLAIDAKGRLWVMENIDYPKRVSVWDSATGKLAKEFFGGAHYSSFIWMDPHHPDEVYCDGTIWKIDWEKLTSAPLLTCWRAMSKDDIGASGFSTHTGGCRIFTAKNGHQYMYDIMMGTLFLREDDIFKPIIAFGAGWVDANNDQKIQPDEINKEVGKYGSWIDPDLTLWGGGAVVRAVKINPDGRPVYDFSKPEPRPVAIRPAGFDPDDNSIYAYDNGYDWNGGQCRTAWSTDGSAPDGSVIWGYRGRVSWPGAINHPPQSLAKIWGITELLGTAGDFTGFATYYGCHHLYTRKDGIPVACSSAIRVWRSANWVAMSSPAKTTTVRS